MTSVTIAKPARRRMRCFATVAALATLFPAAASAGCTLEQRVDLAKAGYNKSEIEKICASATEPAATAAATPSAPPPEVPLQELLGKGTITGGNARDYEKRRCRASQAGISFPDDGLKGYDRIQASTKLSIDREDEEILIVVSLDTGFNTEFCVVMRVDKFRFGDNPKQFETEAAQYETEYETLVAALKKHGIPIE